MNPREDLRCELARAASPCAIYSRASPRFDRALVERIRQLDIETLDSALGSHLTKSQIESILERRDALMLYVEQLVEKKGAGAVWF